MLNEIKQVGISYISQRRLWWVLGLFAMIALPNMIAVAGSSRTAPQVMFLLAFPIMMLGQFFVGHVKMQFAHPRARLMPHFLPPHLGIVAAIVVFMFLIYPVGLAWIAGLNPQGPIALGLAIGAPAIWAAHKNRFLPILISLAVFYSLMTDAGQRFWVSHSLMTDDGQSFWIRDPSQHQAVLTAIVLVCTVVLIIWMWQSCHLNEEMDEYQNNYQMMLARRTGSEAIEQRRVVANAVGRNKLMGAVGDWWHSRLGGYYGGGDWGLSRLLRYGFGATPVEGNALFMLTMFLAIGIFLSRFSWTASAKAGAFGGLWFFVVFMCLLPGQMAGEQLAQRRPRIAFELLLPMSRSRLINGLFVASIRNSIVFWLMMTCGLGLVVVITKMELNLQTALMFILISGACTFTAMSISMRTAVWPSMAKRMMVAWVGSMIVVAPLIGWATQRSNIGDAPFLALSGVMLGLGAFLMHRARQAWLNLESG